MGIKITTDGRGVKVFRSDKYNFPQYAVQIGKKTDKGWINEFQDVQFRKGVELENGEFIHITNAFPTLSTWNDKQTGELRSKKIWMILDFERESQEMPSSFKEQKPEMPSGFGEMPKEEFASDFGFASVSEDTPF